MNKLLLTVFILSLVIFYSCKKNESHPAAPVQYLPASNPESRNQEGKILLGISKRYIQQDEYGIEWSTIRYIPNTSYVESYTDSFCPLPANNYPGNQNVYYYYPYDNSFRLLGIRIRNDTLKINSSNSGQVQNLMGQTGFIAYNYNSASQIVNDSTYLFPNNTLDGYINCSYDNNGNIAQVSVWNNWMDSTKFQNESVTAFSYDNHPNPFYPIKYINYILITAFFQSPNNITKEIQTSSSGTLMASDSIQYVYNSFGYPKYSIDASTGDTTKYYYY